MNLALVNVYHKFHVGAKAHIAAVDHTVADALHKPCAVEELEVLVHQRHYQLAVCSIEIEEELCVVAAPAVTASVAQCLVYLVVGDAGCAAGTHSRDKVGEHKRAVRIVEFVVAVYYVAAVVAVESALPWLKLQIGRRLSYSLVAENGLDCPVSFYHTALQLGRCVGGFVIGWGDCLAVVRYDYFGCVALLGS